MTSDSKPVSVRYVITGLGTGGAERSLSELLEPLQRRGIEVRVTCLERRAHGVQTNVEAMTEVDFVGPGRLRSMRGIRRMLGQQPPDVVHTTLFDADIAGRLASIATHIPVVSSVVNTSYEVPGGRHPDASSPKLAAVRAIDGITARHLVTRFHALTEASAGAAVRTLGISRALIDVVPRGRDTARLGSRTPQRRERVRSALGLVDEQHVFLSAGRQEHQKGQETAVEAMSEVIRSHPTAVLLIAGREGAASKRLTDTAAAIGVTGHVRFLGHREDLPDLMAAADVLVFPSLYEGFGGTIVEAMALGLPVVASDIPVIREVAAESALLTPVGSSHELAEAMTTLLNNPGEATRLADIGRKRFEANFTIESVADRMAGFYRSVISTAGGGTA